MNVNDPSTGGIGRAPVPTKPPKPAGLRVKRAKALSISLLSGSNPTLPPGDSSLSRASTTNNLDNSSASTNTATKPKQSMRSRILRPLTPTLIDSDDEERDNGYPPRSSSALDFYRSFGPTRGLASKDWPSPPRHTSQLPRPMGSRAPHRSPPERNESDEVVVIGKEDAAKRPQRLPDSGRQRSISMTMERSTLKPSTTDTSAQQASADEHRKLHERITDNEPRADSGTPVSNPARALRRPTPPNGNFQPHTSPRAIASPFLNTYTAQALLQDSNAASAAIGVRSRLPRRKPLPAALGKTDIMRSASAALDEPDQMRRLSLSQSRSSYSSSRGSTRSVTPAGDQVAHQRSHPMRTPSHSRTPSTSVLEGSTSSQLSLKQRNRIQSHDYSQLSTASDMRSPSSKLPLPLHPLKAPTWDEVEKDELQNGRSRPPPLPRRTHTELNDRHPLPRRAAADRPSGGAGARPGSPFGFQSSTALHSFGQQLGGMGAAVGKRGWDMVRNWGGTPAANMAQSNVRVTRTLSNGSTATTANSPTRQWLHAPEASLQAQRIRAPGNGLQNGAIFGAPLRKAVILSRLGARAPPSQVGSSSTTQLVGVDLGSDFHVDLPALTEDEARTANRQQVRIASREEARLKYLPAVVVRCIEAVEQWGWEEEGIYRLSGRSSHTSKLRQIFNAVPNTPGRGETNALPIGDLELDRISLSDLDLNSVCSVFKSYLRDLPDTIVPQSMTSAFDDAFYQSCGIQSSSFSDSSSPASLNKTREQLMHLSSAARDEEWTQRLCATMKPFLAKLPAVNWYLLRELAYHLSDLTRPDVVAQTRMPTSNLCLVLAPTLSLSVAVTQAIVENAREIFSDVTPQADEQLDALTVHVARPAGLRRFEQADVASLEAASTRLDEGSNPSHRLSVATVTMEQKRQSVGSVSTLQDAANDTGITTPQKLGSFGTAPSPDGSPLPPVAARFMHSPSLTSLVSGRNGSGSGDSLRIVKRPHGLTSSADSSLPSSYWTGGDRDSEVSSAVTDDAYAQYSSASSSASPSLAPSASNNSLYTSARLADQCSDSTKNVSGRRSALDRPRPPTSGGSNRFFSAARPPNTRSTVWGTKVQDRGAAEAPRSVSHTSPGARLWKDAQARAPNAAVVSDLFSNSARLSPDNESQDATPASLSPATAHHGERPLAAFAAADWTPTSERPPAKSVSPNLMPGQFRSEAAPESPSQTARSAFVTSAPYGGDEGPRTLEALQRLWEGRRLPA